VRLQPVEEIYRPQPARIRLVGGCAAARPDRPGPPQASEDAMTTWLVRQKQLVVCRNYTSRLAGITQPRQRAIAAMIRASAGRGRRMDAATDAAAGLTAWSLETGPAQVQPHPAAGSVATAWTPPVNWPPSRTSAPATPFEALCQACPARSVAPPGRCWPMWTMPAMPCGRKRKQLTSAAGPLGR